MKIVHTLLPLLSVVIFAGCKQRGAQQSPGQTSPAASSLAPSTVEAPKPSAEEIASCVRVRVITGALPVKDYSGALIHHDELAKFGQYFEKNRCVAALLAGWTEAQLRSGDSRIIVIRNVPDSSGELHAVAYNARLLYFDPTTLVSLLSYRQGISAAADAGFHLAADQAPPPAAVALRSQMSDQTDVPVDPRPQRFTAPMRIAIGGFFRTANHGGKVRFQDQTSQTDDSPLCCSPLGILYGFLHGDQNAAALVPPPRVDTSIQFGGFSPVSATFTPTGNGVEASIKLQRPAAEQLSRPLTVYTKEVPPTAEIDQSQPGVVFEPIAGAKARPAEMSRTDPGACLVGLPVPQGDSRGYLIQIGWKDLDDETSPTLFSNPFLVTATSGPAGLTVETKGIHNDSAPKAEQHPTADQFTPGSPILGAFPIAGGTEVLLQLEGAPFWKRFSFEKKQWLPLPEMNGTSVALAGNRSSLFVLDRNSVELRKYNLADLSLGPTCKLEKEGALFSAVRAGCLSDKAPIYVRCERGIIGIDPETLRPLSHIGPNQPVELSKKELLATGDGASLMPQENGSTFDRSFTFVADYVGLVPDEFDMPVPSHVGPPSVSAAFQFDYQLNTCVTGQWKPVLGTIKSGGGMHPFLNASSPHIIMYRQGNPGTIPPSPPHLECYAFGSSDPLWVVEAPELMGLARLDLASKILVLYDSASQRLGVIPLDRKSMVVHDAKAHGKEDVPFLLNWPETTLSPGQEFKFTPSCSTPAKLDAQLRGNNLPVHIETNDFSVSFRLPEDESSSFLLLDLSLSGPDGSSHYPIPIHVRGPLSPYITTDLKLVEKNSSIGEGFKNLGQQPRRIPLKSSFYYSEKRVLNAYGPVDGFMALETEAKHIDFLSLRTLQIAGSIPIPDKSRFYTGCGALYQFDPTTKSLSRLNVPDGRETAHYSVPVNGFLNAIGLGEKKEEPVVLFVETPREKTNPLLTGNWENAHTVLVLNSDTLTQGPWMQPPQLWAEKPDAAALSHAISETGFHREFPFSLAGSRNGAIFNLSRFLLIVTRSFSTLMPYPRTVNDPWGPYRDDSPKGSISGMIASTSAGSIFRLGAEIKCPNPNWAGNYITPCGRYEISPLEATTPFALGYVVRTTDEWSTLLHLHQIVARFPSVDANETFPGAAAGGMWLAGDNGPLVIRSPGGHLLQVIDFNIPKLAAAALPDACHVVSQPLPCIMEGASYDYQIQVNNPSVVSAYRFRTQQPNATLSLTGLLHYTAPQNVHAPTEENLSIEIVTKNGGRLLYDFPIMVMPKHNPAAPATHGLKLGTAATSP